MPLQKEVLKNDYIPENATFYVLCFMVSVIIYLRNRLKLDKYIWYDFRYLQY